VAVSGGIPGDQIRECRRFHKPEEKGIGLWKTYDNDGQQLESLVEDIKRKKLEIRQEMSKKDRQSRERLGRRGKLSENLEVKKEGRMSGRKRTSRIDKRWKIAVAVKK
jgi:hypothetical protein